MKIILATPLYPPDIALPAIYAKELATRLKNTYEVKVVAYSRFPEKILGVEIVAIDKHYPIFIRLFLYAIALLKAALSADLIYVQNGSSVELPAIIVSVVTGIPLTLQIIDKPAHIRASQSPVLRTIEKFAMRRAKKVINDIPLNRPEILPFKEMPRNAISQYENSWRSHIKKLEEVFTYAISK